MRLIDADALADALFDQRKNYPQWVADTICNMQEAVVRCKDCVYWQDNNEGYPHKDCKWRDDETPDPDDYCSAGERMGGR